MAVVHDTNMLSIPVRCMCYIIEVSFGLLKNGLIGLAYKTSASSELLIMIAFVISEKVDAYLKFYNHVSYLSCLK